CPGKGLPSC
nr:Chain C, CYS-PRO-GLY-LYS-GLY-LEU-PRO-SER-CYS [synthetic construct]8G8N_F Chain F, CYS-PRO-GLY-LYS-GLY-LEU-PRO-SER-CYS [synthetic construct]8G8N_J Chain J, CYS-PRO-GLY-LYS-GLY-LEU-PRO-SER-CYS [synthetic construct]8G8N_P Chain P, CYS-PRO-GLY-LYS-GLY-LEU-PRO-SER-CYS [synthetic construct]8G8N_R Chain R, CYS-PRO-GLY-LYS-GLY-LEU-PRO-SER-CYS [synthetic construct]8G8N_Z Chain Z, CYS-PRO-GLY-LYS-GLY-LEU-PRO-SER-CYS [synthetic construct]